jgi:hypothetical protein
MWTQTGSAAQRSEQQPRILRDPRCSRVSALTGAVGSRKSNEQIPTSVLLRFRFKRRYCAVLPVFALYFARKFLLFAMCLACRCMLAAGCLFAPISMLVSFCTLYLRKPSKRRVLVLASALFHFALAPLLREFWQLHGFGHFTANLVSIHRLHTFLALCLHGAEHCTFRSQLYDTPTRKCRCVTQPPGTRDPGTSSLGRAIYTRPQRRTELCPVGHGVRGEGPWSCCTSPA